MQRKRFFSGDGPQDLPLLSSSASNNSTSLGNIRSPPSSSNSFDFGRLVPGRASSMSLVRQKPGGHLSLSPQSSSQRVVSNLFPASHSETNLTHVGYGMLNPGPNSYGSHNRSSNGSWACHALAVTGMVILAVLGLSSYNQNNLLRQELIFKETEVAMHMDHAHALERRASQMRGETLHLYDKLDELEHPPQTQEELNIQRKVVHLERYHEHVNQGIQENSRRVLREK